ncbi:histidine phosphatase family protein [Sphingomonas ginsenosidivorax]|uniref:Histidine phosphatase family protein n=1 Tax=Sphingomonas ginsenosidivorax TaxID=862135 RepID=A0A5C6UJB2_9SPHN|nr:histidine phosphatase family protein [Sphingomonas ginsenosidivorax]TXC72892.1 histidine phosphatase family protein [Sphingomonas ginsenosidivorax]
MRHGAPVLTGRLLGRTDSPATEAGIAACVAQAEGLEVSAVVSSDLVRASACAAALGGAATIDPRWRELDFGEWDGLAAAEIDAAPLGRFWDDPDANPPPGGERWSSLTARVAAAVAAVTVPTLVVTHGGAMRAALAGLCGFGQRELWAFDLPYASVLALKVWPGPTPTAQIAGLW